MEMRNARRIENGGIEVTVNHPKYGWVDMALRSDDPDPQGRQLWQDAQSLRIAPYVAPPMFASRDQARAALLAWQNEVLAPYTEGYTQQELMSWPVKRDAAEAYVADTATVAQSDMIESEAAAAGRSAGELAARILELSDQYSAIIAVMSGVRSTAQTAIAEGTTSEEWEAAIEAAKAFVPQ